MYRLILLILACITLASCITTIHEENEITEFQFEDGTVQNLEDEEDGDNEKDSEDVISWIIRRLI